MFTLNKCPVCDNTLKGRSDKKFCSPKCKSIHQYEKRQSAEAFYVKVDRQLKVNRKILKRYNRSGFTTIRTAELAAQGFDARYFTHQWQNKKGDTYHFVYDYGFLPTAQNGKQKYLLVTWQPYMGHGPA